MSCNKVIFVLGQTGSGKSKLAIDIALTFNGEIVNADSMQIYEGNGCGTMTAKPSLKDHQKVKHHLYDIVDMNKVADFNVQKYAQLALACIEDIHSRGKVPVITGGTNYYIEALLFENPQEAAADLKDPNSSPVLKEKYRRLFKGFRSAAPAKFTETISDFEAMVVTDQK